MLARLKDSSAASIITKKASELYDSSFAYRLCYNLRNFGQHHSNPLNIIPVNAKRNAHGELEYQIDLELDPDRLTGAESKFQPRVKAELRGMGDKVPLLENCREYYDGIQHLLDTYLSLSGPDILSIAYYETAVRRKFPHMPADATPMMFHGRPSKVGDEFKTRATSFSFDELALLKQLLLEIKSGNSW